MNSDPKKTPRSGFAERPQEPLEGTPESGPVADWADDIDRQAKAEKPPGKARRDRKTTAGRTARGTSIGGSKDPKTRAAAGLNPVAGLDMSLEEAQAGTTSGVTATVDALSKLIESGNPHFRDGKAWVPHRPERPEKSEGGIEIRMQTDFEPSGDQPTAISDLVSGLKDDDRTQVLLGVTGSGKTFTMAKVIEETQRPALVLAPNKTLAAQLYGEFRNFFPDNAVEYFVSYYDYYQPEAYVPRSDTYIGEGIVDQRADRPHASFRNPRPDGTGRRDHRRLGLLHLRHRLRRDLHGDGPSRCRSATAWTSASFWPTWWRSSTGAPT